MYSGTREKSDGLAWYHASKQSDEAFVFRTDGLRSMPSISDNNMMMMEKGLSYTCMVTVTESGAAYWVNRNLIAKCSYSKDKVKQRGTVGFMALQNV